MSSMVWPGIAISADPHADEGLADDPEPAFGQQAVDVRHAPVCRVLDRQHGALRRHRDLTASIVSSKVRQGSGSISGTALRQASCP